MEGGAETGASFLDSDLVDRLILVQGPVEIGDEGVRAPIDVATARSRFRLVREYRFGDDHWYEFERRAA